MTYQAGSPIYFIAPQVEFKKGFDKYPKPIKSYARKNLSPAHYVIWEIVWDKTLGWEDVRNGTRSEWDAISNSQFEEEMNMSGRRIRDALNWMVENEWLERRMPNGSQIWEYRLHPNRLQEGLYAQSVAWEKEQKVEREIQMATPDETSALPRTKRPTPKKGSKERSNYPPTPLSVSNSIGEKSSSKNGGGNLRKLNAENSRELMERYDGIYPQGRMEMVLGKLRAFNTSYYEDTQELFDQYEPAPGEFWDQIKTLEGQITSGFKPIRAVKLLKYRLDNGVSQ